MHGALTLLAISRSGSLRYRCFTPSCPFRLQRESQAKVTRQRLFHQTALATKVAALENGVMIAPVSIAELYEQCHARMVPTEQWGSFIAAAFAGQTKPEDMLWGAAGLSAYAIRLRRQMIDVELSPGAVLAAISDGVATGKLTESEERRLMQLFEHRVVAAGKREDSSTSEVPKDEGPVDSPELDATAMSMQPLQPMPTDVRLLNQQATTAISAV